MKIKENDAVGCMTVVIIAIIVSALLLLKGCATSSSGEKGETTNPYCVAVCINRETPKHEPKPKPATEKPPPEIKP